MKTVSPDDAAEVLRGGGVALVPTETVVGLVAAEAGRLNEIKGSDPGKPIALLCASAERAFELAANASSLAELLAERYWPGPLTLVLDGIDGRSVGVRVPADSAVRKVLEAYGEPLYATSANPSGELAPKGLEGVEPKVYEAVDVMVEGDPGSGEASAVVDLSGGRARLLRATEKLSKEELTRLVAVDEG
jgi:L-threonylcarbamoyladenylate synthase